MSNKKVLLLSSIILLSIIVGVLVYQVLSVRGTTPHASRETETISQAPQHIRIAISRDITTLDIAMATAVVDFEVLGKVYEVLFRIDYDLEQGRLKYVPWLIERYAYTNETFWVFRVKDSVYFHNGKKLTSYDVNASIVRAVKLGGIPKMLFTDAKGEPIIETITIFNETTFGIKLKSSFAPLIEHLAHLSMAIMPREIAEKYMDRPITEIGDIIGTGPYRVIEWVRGHSVRLSRHDNYWRGSPATREIEYLVIADANARIAAIKSGQVDIAVGIPVDAIDMLKSEGVRVLVNPTVRHVIVAINNERIPSVSLRCAMNYAVDKEAIVKGITKGYGTPSSSIISPSLPGAVSLKPYEYNPQKARELVNRAGGINRTLTLLIVAGRDVELAEAIRQYLKEVGIDVTVTPIENAAFLKKVFTEHDFDLAIYGPSPSSTYYALTYWRTGSYLNGPQYSNPYVDELLDLAMSTHDEGERFRLYRSIQEIIWSECPAIWLYYDVVVVATKPSIENVIVLPFQYLVLDNVVGLRR